MKLQTSITMAISAMLATTLSAQIQVSGETATVVGAMAHSSTSKQLKTVKAGTKFSRHFRNVAYVRGAVASNTAGTGQVRHSRHGNYSYAYLSISGRAMSFSSKGNVGAHTTKDPVKGVPGAFGMKYSFSAKTPTKGRLKIVLGGMASKGASAALSITFGKTTLKWNAGSKPVTKEMDVTLDSKGMTFLVGAQGGAMLKGRGRIAYGARASIIFAPKVSSGGGCTIKKGPASCGPDLSGKVTSGNRGHLVNLSLTKAPARSFGVMLFSTDGKMRTLKNKCLLFTRVVGFRLFRTTSKGTATHLLPLPKGRNLQFAVQDAILMVSRKGIDLKTSNGVMITCKK
ncbi:MAG TPA: hypothetical protein ENK02_05350 [Planctomycetes bacterium]|nr:hypothetical protein [Planctomycetota bacterium]